VKLLFTFEKQNNIIPFHQFFGFLDLNRYAAAEGIGGYNHHPTNLL
jgi:hypothetical protein